MFILGSDGSFGAYDLYGGARHITLTHGAMQGGGIHADNGATGAHANNGATQYAPQLGNGMTPGLPGSKCPFRCFI